MVSDVESPKEESTNKLKLFFIHQAAAAAAGDSCSDGRAGCPIHVFHFKDILSAVSIAIEN